MTQVNFPNIARVAGDQAGKDGFNIGHVDTPKSYEKLDSLRDAAKRNLEPSSQSVLDTVKNALYRNAHNARLEHGVLSTAFAKEVIKTAALWLVAGVAITAVSVGLTPVIGAAAAVTVGFVGAVGSFAAFTFASNYFANRSHANYLNSQKDFLNALSKASDLKGAGNSTSAVEGARNILEGNGDHRTIYKAHGEQAELKKEATNLLKTASSWADYVLAQAKGKSFDEQIAIYEVAIEELTKSADGHSAAFTGDASREARAVLGEKLIERALEDGKIGHDDLRQKAAGIAIFMNGDGSASDAQVQDIYNRLLDAVMKHGYEGKIRTLLDNMKSEIARLRDPKQVQKEAQKRLKQAEQDYKSTVEEAKKLDEQAQKLAEEIRKLDSEIFNLIGSYNAKDLLAAEVIYGNAEEAKKMTEAKAKYVEMKKKIAEQERVDQAKWAAHEKLDPAKRQLDDAQNAAFVKSVADEMEQEAKALEQNYNNTVGLYGDPKNFFAGYGYVAPFVDNPDNVLFKTPNYAKPIDQAVINQMAPREDETQLHNAIYAVKNKNKEFFDLNKLRGHARDLVMKHLYESAPADERADAKFMTGTYADGTHFSKFGEIKLEEFEASDLQNEGFNSWVLKAMEAAQRDLQAEAAEAARKAAQQAAQAS